MKTHIILGTIIGLIIIAGCVQQFWPTPKHSPVVDEYTGIPPEKTIWDFLPFSTLGKEEQTKQIVIDKHLTEQINLEALMETDEVRYGLALNEVKIIIKKGQDEFQQIIGTITTPGILMSILLAGAGAAGGKLYANQTMYSEAEIKEIKKNGGTT